MFKNIILISFRNFRRQKIHTLVNLSGLSLGISAVLVIFLLLSFLTSYDRYHKNFDHIYRLVTQTDKSNGQEKDYTTGLPIVLPEAFKNDFPNVKAQAFISYKMSGIVTIDEQKEFEEGEGLAYSEAAFFEIFDRKLLKGNPEKVLTDPGKVVISEKFAKKYFNGDDPIGKTFTMDFDKEFMVEGVMEDFPNNTDFPFDMLIAYSTVRAEREEHEGWGSISSDDQLYILLHDTESKVQIEAALPAFVEKYFGDHNSNNKVISLQPLSNLHFSEYYANFNFKSVTTNSMMVMAIIGLFLLVTSCVNFINLSTALAVKRSREVGIRKVMGSSRFALIMQLLGETALMVILAMIISFGLGELALYYLNPMLDTSLAILKADIPLLFSFLLLLFVSLTLLAGLYPARLISGFKPVDSLKNNLSNRYTGGKSLRQGLVIFQFVISQVFIIGTIVVYQQTNFLKTVDMGFNREALLTVMLRENNPVRMKSFKQAVAKLKDVEQVTLAYRPPSSGSVSATNVQFPSNPDDYISEVKLADDAYAETYGLKFLAGENISESDTLKDFIINEALMRLFGVNDPEKAIGEELTVWGRTGFIRGVVANFQTHSMKDRMQPVFIASAANNYQIAGIKVNSSNMQKTKQEIESIYNQYFENYSFECEFLDEEIAGFYEDEENMSTLFNKFSLIAIFIGMLGLYGLVAYLTEIKTKEIGVRKALGASIFDVLVLLTKGYTILIAIAFAFSAPLSWWLMSTWLEEYPTRIPLNFYTFLAGGAISLLVAWFTATYTSVKAARLNPSVSLRDN